MIMLDTNVLVYAVDTTAAAHVPCRRTVQRAMSGSLDAVIVPQVLMEFYAVVTSPRRVRTPLAPTDAMAQVNDWRATIPVHYPTARCLDELTALVSALQRPGQGVHDLFLAAQMLAHGISDICTLNAGDFAGITRIAVRTPAAV